jgi:hypothetical protein
VVGHGELLAQVVGLLVQQPIVQLRGGRQVLGHGLAALHAREQRKSLGHELVFLRCTDTAITTATPIAVIVRFI